MPGASNVRQNAGIEKPKVGERRDCGRRRGLNDGQVRRNWRLSSAFGQPKIDGSTAGFGQPKLEGSTAGFGQPKLEGSTAGFGQPKLEGSTAEFGQPKLASLAEYSAEEKQETAVDEPLPPSDVDRPDFKSADVKNRADMNDRAGDSEGFGQPDVFGRRANVTDYGYVKQPFAGQYTGRNGPVDRNRTFLDWSVYKGRSAIAFKPIAPKIEQKDAYRMRTRTGALLVEAASSVGLRQYNWQNKLNFALSIVELGSILADPDGAHNFVHDPSIQTIDKGKTIKTLSVSKAADGNWFFNLRVQDQREGDGQRISVALTPAEFEVFKINIQFLIPRLFALDQV